MTMIKEQRVCLQMVGEDEVNEERQNEGLRKLLECDEVRKFGLVQSFSVWRFINSQLTKKGISKEH